MTPLIKYERLIGFPILIFSLILASNFSGSFSQHNTPIPVTGSVSLPRTNPDLPSPLTAATAGTDWPQVQRDPQHTGFSPDVLGTQFSITWVHAFQPDRLFPQVQPIAYQNKIFIGTEAGRLYAFEATSGVQDWVYPVDGPILSSVAAGDGKIFLAAMDGAVYALDANSGSLAWKSQVLWRLGFSASPVLADNKLMVGGRDGVFYAIDPSTGATLWQTKIGTPILQTAAYDNGKVVFGGMDMRVYALQTSNGAVAWQSEELAGLAFKDYWPVIYQGRIIIRPVSMGAVSDPNACDANPTTCLKSLYVLDENTGSELPTVQHGGYPVMNGAMTPPCVDRNGKLVIGYDNRWGELDFSTRLLNTNSFVDSSGEDGFHNGDETENISCSQNLLLVMHTREDTSTNKDGPGYSGAFDLDTQKWTTIFPGFTTREMFNNTQSAGGNPASIAYGMVFHASVDQLIARSTQP